MKPSGKDKNHKINRLLKPASQIIIMALVLMIFSGKSGKGAISSVTLTPTAATLFSNAKSYYAAGIVYTFRVQAADPAATGKGDWTSIQLEFISGGTQQNCTIAMATDTATVENGVVVDSIVDNTAIYTNLDYTIQLRFLWTATPFNAAATNQVRATVIGTSTANDTVTMNYGVCSQMQVLNFSQDGDASDGRVNPWHQGFNVTGRIVYYVAGESITNRIEDTDAGETGNCTLFVDGATTVPAIAADADDSDNVSYAIPVDYMNDNLGGDPGSLGNHTWDVRVAMNTGGATETSVNTLTVNCDKVQVDSIVIYDGGGIDAPNYYRSVNIAGTRIRVTASLQNGGGNVVGNTSAVVSDGTNTFLVQINDATASGNALITIPTPVQVPDGTTGTLSYEVIRIYGGAYDGHATNNWGQYQNSRINHILADPVVYWDRNDPPGINGVAPNYHGDTAGVGTTPFSTGFSYSQTAETITLNWTPLSALGSPPYDLDFYSYRVYYKEASAGSWTIIDRTTSGYGPAETYDLSDVTTGTMSISGLLPFKEYNYYITAIDVFGQEVDTTTGFSDAIHENGGTATDFSSIVTNPTELQVTISDGITRYQDSAFTGEAVPVPSNRPLRNSAIHVTVFFVSVEGQPDSMNIILSDFPGADLVGGVGLSGTEGTDYDRIACAKSGPNTWTAQIPTTNRYMVNNTEAKFIVESVKNGVNSYADHDSDFDPAEQVPPGDPNDMEWTFRISSTTTFQPWPTRILNNVITKSNPVAYPAYYLSEDAYVTIKVYDIKGRPVATILDGALRKGGQNIKDQGWRGTNKSRRELGVGLYYIHIRARSVSGGKTILNNMKKVVIKR